ncbi:4-hydroxy-tetrahydrodipicolinate synthase [Paenibacillus yanchengensis]|uniref:4-hydroxy-tetrahydrodipicolinate synthase n=1 Tax=Paenibacillus yanchengensis TaxID=2035833 RepID=A0ABW4YGV9_9BACL
MFKPQGIIPALITPFLANGKIDEETLRTMIQRQITSGVHGIFVLGTNGEFFSLHEDEKVELVKIAADEIKGKVPLYAGSGAITTEESVRLSQKLEKVGADVLSVITPYFVPINQEELATHYKAVAASTSLPIVLYNIPARTGIMLEASTVAQLSHIENIVGIKDSSGNYEHLLQLIDQASDEFAVLAGTDSFILSALLAGGSGAIAASANVSPSLVVSIYDYYQAGKLTDARRAQSEIAEIRKLMKMGTVPAALKEVMRQLGYGNGLPRLPVLPADVQTKTVIENSLRTSSLQHLKAHV